MSEVTAGRSGADGRLLDALAGSLWDILSHAPGGVLVVDLHGIVAWANEAVAAICACGLGEVVGASVGALLAPGESAATLTTAEAPDGGAARVRTRVRRPDGSIRLVAADVWVVRDGPEAVGRFIVLTDETRRLAAEARVVANETSYVEVFDHAPVGLAIVTTEGVFVEANAAYHDILGYEVGELKGMRIADVTIDDDLELSLQRVRELSSGEIEGYTLEKRYRRKDGSAVWAELHVSAVRDASGRIEFCIGLINDISARKRAEAATAEVQSELELRNHDLENFASVASHDLKAPLQTIVGFLEMILITGGEGIDTSARMFIDRAMGGAHRMAELIDSMLDFARSGTSAMVVEELDVEAVLATVFGRLRGVITDVDVDLDFGDLGTLRADRTALEIVLQNLLSNAIAYRRPEVTLQLVVEGRVLDGAYQLRVIDNGRGIAPEEREAVFAMFHRGSEVGFGSGIGLATVGRLVARHGGEVHIEDGIDGGVAIVVTIPQ